MTSVNLSMPRSVALIDSNAFGGRSVAAANDFYDLTEDADAGMIIQNNKLLGRQNYLASYLLASIFNNSLLYSFIFFLPGKSIQNIKAINKQDNIRTTPRII